MTLESILEVFKDKIGRQEIFLYAKRWWREVLSFRDLKRPINLELSVWRDSMTWSVAGLFLLLLMLSCECKSNISHEVVQKNSKDDIEIAVTLIATNVKVGMPPRCEFVHAMPLLSGALMQLLTIICLGRHNIESWNIWFGGVQGNIEVNIKFRVLLNLNIICFYTMGNFEPCAVWRMKM